MGPIPVQGAVAPSGFKSSVSICAKPGAAVQAKTVAFLARGEAVAENPRQNDPDERGRAANQQQADNKQQGPSRSPMPALPP